jgi:hypothetical protein
MNANNTNGTNIAAALGDLIFKPGLDLQEAPDRHFAPDYRQRTDGRFRRVEEVTLMLEGAEADRNLGSAR